MLGMGRLVDMQEMEKGFTSREESQMLGPERQRLASSYLFMEEERGAGAMPSDLS